LSFFYNEYPPSRTWRRHWPVPAAVCAGVSDDCLNWAAPATASCKLL
jgi:hypothetical protein